MHTYYKELNCSTLEKTVSELWYILKMKNYLVINVIFITNFNGIKKFYCVRINKGHAFSNTEKHVQAQKLEENI